jgi:hypothetical protein
LAAAKTDQSGSSAAYARPSSGKTAFQEIVDMQNGKLVLGFKPPNFLSSIALVLILLCVSSVFAQSDRGTVTGFITDSSGAVLPHTLVSMRNLNTGEVYQGEATNTGSYTIAALPAGKYGLRVAHPGFKDYVQDGITISVAETTRQNVSLTVGSASETVTVNADAAQLKTENAEQSTTISRNTLNELPVAFALAGAIRDPLAFAKLAPGVESGVTGNGFRVNGLPTDSFKITVDGVDSTNANLNDREDGNHPSVEMLEEFTLQSSNISAEFGQVGGGLFNFTARSGTNDLHGSAYDNLANDRLNADQPYSGLSYPAPYMDHRARNHQNDYGFLIAGPVWIPKLYNGRNRTFFVFNYERYVQNNGTPTTETVPTTRERTGDFGEILTTQQIGTDPLGRPIYNGAIYDPNSARAVNGQVVTDPFPANVIPAGELDQVAVKTQAFIPAPTVSGTLNNYGTTITYPTIHFIPAVKIDQAVTQKWKSSFYWSRLSESTLSSADGLPLPISAVRTTISTVDTWRFNNDYTVTPNLLVHAGFGYVRYPNLDSSPAAVTNYNALTGLGLPNTVALGFPRFGGLNGTFGGIINGNGNGLGPTQRNDYEMDKANAVANVVYTRGNHTYKAGAEYRNDMWYVDSSINVAGSYNFSTSETALPYNGSNTFKSGSNTGTVGFQYASFLLGQVDSGSIGNAVINQYHRPGWSLFVQDTWKLRKNLTLDYGLRWDFTQTEHERDYRTSGFNPNVVNPNAGGRLGALEFEGFGTGQCHCNFSPYYPYALGPRLGVAYQVDSKTVFRGGFAVTYGQNPVFDYAGSNFSVVSVGFNVLSFSSPSYGTTNTTLSKGFQYNPALITSANHDPGYNCCTSINSAASPYFSPNGGRPSRIFNYTVSMQRAVTKDITVELSYVGNRASWLVSGDSGNLGLLQLNATSAARLNSFGFDPTNLVDANLLNGTYAAFLASGDSRISRVPLPYTGFPTGQKLAQALRPYPQYGTIYSEYSPDAKSWYDALQVKVSKRLSHNFELLDSFTWSKELDEGTDTERGRGAQINDALNRASNKFLTSSYVPYINVTSLTYQLPNLPYQSFQKHGILREAFTGWTIGAIMKYQDGALIRVPGANPGGFPALSNLLERGTYANRVPGVPLFLKNPNCHCFNAGTDVLFNYQAWSEPPVGTFSTGSPYDNDYRWQRQPDEEMNIGKKFFIPIGREQPATLQVRAEFFDVFNRALYPTATGASGNFEVNSTNNTTVSAFGRINTANFGRSEYRTGQFVARFQF